MKKDIYFILLITTIVIFVGTYIFNLYNSKTEKVSAQYMDTIYAFQYGVYSNKENMINHLKNINYTYQIIDNKYHAYVGLTKNNKEKLKNYFDKMSYNLYIKEIKINNEFTNVLKQYDILLEEANNDKKLESVLKTILAKFEEYNEN